MQYPVTIKQKDGTEKTFWLSDEKLQFGGTDSGVTDVKINGTSIVDGGVANVPVATNSEYGTVKVRSGGGICFDSSTGAIQTERSSDNGINSRDEYYKPIVPANLDRAVKAALTDARKIAYTDAEKASARATIGAVAVSEIPYAEGTTGGLVKVSGFGLATNTNHYMYVDRASDAQIDAKSNSYYPIVPSNLDYAVKASLSHSTVEWTDAETAAARDVLGVPIGHDNSTGLVRPNPFYNIASLNDGTLYCVSRTEAQYKVGGLDNFISKGTLENIRNGYVKASLTDANKMTMTAAEQASARETLGLEEMMLGNSKMHLIGTQTLSADGKANVTFTEEVDNMYVDVIIPIMSTDSVSVPGMQFVARDANDTICGTCWISGINNLGTQYAHQATMFTKKEAGKYATDITQWSVPTNGQATQRMIHDFATSFPDATKRLKKFATGNNLPAGTVINVYGYNDETAVSPMTKRKIYDQTLTSATGNVTVDLDGKQKRLQTVLYLPQTETALAVRLALIIDSIQKASTVLGNSSTTESSILVMEAEKTSDDGVYHFYSDHGGKVFGPYSGTWNKIKVVVDGTGTSLPAGTRVVVYEIGEQAVPREEPSATLLSTTTFDGNTDLVAFNGGSDNYSAIFFHYKSNVSTGGDTITAFFGTGLIHSWAYEMGSASIKPNQAHLTIPMFSTNNIIWSPCINGNQSFSDNFSDIKTGLINTAHIYFSSKPASGTVLEIWGVKA